MKLLALIPFLMFLPLSAQGQVSEPEEATQEQLSVYLKNALSILAKNTEPEIVANKDLLEAVLTRYYLDRSTLKPSEIEIAKAFLGSATREGGMDIKAVLKAKTKPKADLGPNPYPHSDVKGSSVSFSSRVRRAPGGKQIGVVELKSNGKKITLVEVATGAGLSVEARAAALAKRFNKISATDPTWWMKLGIGEFRSQTVVTTPRALDRVVVTADPPFARLCGTSPKGLATMLIGKIRDGIEPFETGRRSDPTPEAMLKDAVESRQLGDDLAETNKTAAIAAYREAIQSCPTYVIPYLQLAALEVESGHKADAIKVLEEGLKVPNMAKEDKAELAAELKKLKT